MEDHQIIELYFARDELAIEETAKRYGGVCMQVSMDILQDRMDAEECVSDTWLQTWRTIPPQRPTILKAFLCRITRNLSLNRLRDLRREKRNQELTVSFEELEACIPAAMEDAGELAKIFRDLGEEPQAGRMAKAIAAARAKKRFETTLELADFIERLTGRRGGHHPATRVFQALRMAVNDEMGELERALDAVPGLLESGGKCICVTFHSLEDRIVKNTFRKWTTALGDPRMPVLAPAPFELIKAATPSDVELENNSRARSAHMRGVIKV